MAISSELIGSLGGDPEVTNSRFWFSSSDRAASELNKSWNVPRGNYLFVWQGTPRNHFVSNSRIFLNGQLLVALEPGGSVPIGGYVLLENVTSITLTGEGKKRFDEDPYAAFVKVK